MFSMDMQFYLIVSSLTLIFIGALILYFGLRLEKRANKKEYKIIKIYVRDFVNLILFFTLLLSVGVLLGINIGYKLSLNEAQSTGNEIILGTYNPVSTTITIYSNKDRNNYSNLDQTWYHEKCHYFYYKFMDEDQRNNYYLLFNQSAYSPTVYANETKDVAEDFAETCSLYTLYKLNKIKNVLDPPRTNFMNIISKDLLKSTVYGNIYNGEIKWKE